MFDHWDLVQWAVLIGLCLAIREFWTWYLKINQLVSLLKSIDASLKELPAVQQARRMVP